VIVVGTTIAAYKMAEESEWRSWLTHAEHMVMDARRNGHEIKWFCAIEVDRRGAAMFAPLIAELETLGGEHWTFSIDTKAEALSSDERLFHICEGRNLVTEFAMREAAAWILHLDTDLVPDPDTFDKLLALDHPVVGGDVPHYVLSGERVPGYDFPVEAHWNTAGYLLVARDVFRRIRWRYDTWPKGTGTDDPSWAADVLQFTGYVTLVRKDCVGMHRSLIPLEHRGHDLEIRR